MKKNEVQHVFLVGAKSLGAYGGYETFINKLTEYHQNNEKIKYHVACKANGDGSMDPYQTEGAEIVSEREFLYHNAQCFRINIPEKIGATQAIYYDVAALRECCRIIKEENIPHPIVYILACRIGPFMKHFVKKIHKLGGKVYLNPDGHEWMRAKWSKPVRKYWKLSEQMMVKHADLVICDSKNIEKYIQKSYEKYNPKTTFIAYGAEIRSSILKNDDPKLTEWYAKHAVRPKEYYLVVGRFVPENNYETMIREFMKSDTTKDFVLITNVEKNRFYEELKEQTHFDKDSRIKFVGTVYEEELLKKIREDAFAYFHGHEVGGTNPSLLEALGSTELNLLLDVGFNREVGENGALYWDKKDGSLARLIEKADRMTKQEISGMGVLAKKRIEEAYSWEYIVGKYEKVWEGRKNL